MRSTHILAGPPSPASTSPRPHNSSICSNNNSTATTKTTPLRGFRRKSAKGSLESKKTEEAEKAEQQGAKQSIHA
ncbi:hypothetical protein PIB30_058223 [Stylosanthes scabra]|uniref:Uncharacterized protein n=1 Tax=Stylosanthes scabra TaxID=79078 RepID=A0ABU6TKI1_9FABA|nr:hypothetical protein [Stylosanthes scabra]